MQSILKLATALTLGLFIGNSQAQISSTNNYNSNGKKQGYWIEHIDENFQVTDSLNFAYKRYQYFDNGKAIFPYKFYYGYLAKVALQSETYNIGNKWLNGTVTQKAYNKNGKVDVYVDGHPVKFTYYTFFSKQPHDTGIVETYIFNRMHDTTTIAFSYHYSNLYNSVKAKGYYKKNKKARWDYFGATPYN